VDKAQLRPMIAKVFAEISLDSAPIGVEKAQEMIAACGVQPEEKVFSQGTLETRGE
jgi:hypothetical protein